MSEVTPVPADLNLDEDLIPNFTVQIGGITLTFDPIVLADQIGKRIGTEKDPATIRDALTIILGAPVTAHQALKLMRVFEKFATERVDAILKKDFGIGLLQQPTTELIPSAGESLAEQNEEGLNLISL